MENKPTLTFRATYYQGRLTFYPYYAKVLSAHDCSVAGGIVLSNLDDNIDGDDDSRYSFSDSGDENLFLTLSTRLGETLSKQTVEWRQTYSRGSHSFNLNVKILPLTSALLKSTDLVTRPYFHIFWTDCSDVELYKSTTKAEISSWLNTLSKNKATDWMIVVITDDILSRLSKAKLPLPRTSISDKVKSDFCSKSSDRLHILQEATKDTSKSSESWSSLASKVATFTVRCMEGVVSKYEENVRAERERRNEKTWDFCSYFILQEELAFVYEMLGMYSAALVQYDELDAMFTQYVLNANAGDVAHWLVQFSRPITRWHSMLLWKRIDGDARQTILDGSASIIDIRNYLFARLCHLLFEMGKVTEVTHRMHFFLHSIATEIAILEIEIPAGAIACWVFMCCLELVGALKRKAQMQNGTSDAQPSPAASDMPTEKLVLENASLWNIGRLKLYSLGELCGLLPGVATTSEQLQIVVDLLAGMGEGEERNDLATSPALVLREAVSSVKNFQRQYFELSELAMGTFKHMGHYRAVKCIGADLANFYLLLGEPAQAESFLRDTVRMYADDGWPLLHRQASEMLARCYKQMIDIKKYLRLCYQLMCDEALSETDRRFYSDQFRSLSTDLGDQTLALNIHPIATVTAIQFIPAQTSFRQHSRQHLVAHVTCHAPMPIAFQKVQICLQHFKADEYAEVKGVPDATSISSFISKVSCDSDADSPSLSSRSNSRTAAQHDVKKAPHSHHRRRPSGTSHRELMILDQEAVMDDEGRIEIFSLNYDNSPNNRSPSKLPPFISLTEQIDLHRDSTIAWAGVVCHRAHDLLRRQDSGQSHGGKRISNAVVTMETYDCCLETTQVTLKPGPNKIEFELKTELEGTYNLQQLRLSLHKTFFVLPHIYPLVSYNVTFHRPQVRVEQEEGIISGIVQPLRVVVNAGDHLTSEEEQHLTFDLPSSVRLLAVFKCSVHSSEDEEIPQEVNRPLLIHDGGQVRVSLPKTPLYATTVLQLACLCSSVPYVQTKENRRGHRRTHSAPPAPLPRSPKMTPHHVPIIETLPSESPPSDDDVENETTAHDEENAADSTDVDVTETSAVARSNNPLTNLKESLRIKRTNLKKRLIRSKTPNDVTKNRTRFDDWPSVPHGDVIMTPSLLLNDDLIEVTLDDNDQEVISATRTASPAAVSFMRTIASDWSMMSRGACSSDEGSDIEAKRQVIPRRSPVTFTRHTPSRSDADINLTLPILPPARSESPAQITYDITITPPWGNDARVTSSLICLLPLEFTHSWIGRLGNERMITVTVDNTTLSTLTLQNPSLNFTNVTGIKMTSLCGTKRRLLKPKGNCVFGWKLRSVPANISHLSAQFDVVLVSRVGDVSDCDEITSTSSYKFEVENVRPIYVVSCVTDSDNPLRSGAMTSLRVDVMRLRNDPGHENTASGQQLLMFQVMDTRGRWAVCGKSSGILSMPGKRLTGVSDVDAAPVATATLDVMPLVAGYLHLPFVLLHRFMKRRSSEFDEQLSSTESPVLKPPRLKEFEKGEVFFQDQAAQVRVLSPDTDANYATQL